MSKPTVAPTMGKMPPAASEEAEKARALDNASERRQDEARKSVERGEDSLRRGAGAPELLRDRERAAAPLKEEKKAAAETVPPPPAAAKPAVAAPPAPAAEPVPPPAPSAPAPKPEPKPAPQPVEAPADKKKEADAVVKQEDPKPKRTTGAEPAADAAPTHLTLASTQMAKARPEVEVALRELGVLPPPPPPVKGYSRPPVTQYTVELTDTQIARLREKLEKSGTSRLVVAAPDDPVLAQFKPGGVFAAKKDVASGGARSKSFETKPDTKDAKEFSDAGGAKAPAEGATEKPGEPRRKVVLHLLEVGVLPDRPPPPEPAKK